ncbi:MAG: HD domain-containing protein [Acidaminococcaceae bacterium]
MIKDFKAGNKIQQPVLLRVQKIGNSSNGGVFARGLIEDNSGCIPFICFEAGIVDKLRAFEAPKAIVAGGIVDINKFASDMSLQLIVQKLEEIKAEDDITKLMPTGNVDLVEYEAKLQTLMSSVTDAGLKKLLSIVLSGEVYQQFLINPAGMRLHHAYVGGLLHHSVAVAEIALALANKIGKVDRNLVLVGALLHDLGKLHEISPEMGFPYTTEGRLLGHISISAMLLKEQAKAVPELEDKKLQHLLHIILSHHGEQEKGSPIACATKESFIVHYADEIDAIMNQFDKKEGKEAWEYNKMLQRFLLLEA